jgi:hypothetical protein
MVPETFPPSAGARDKHTVAKQEKAILASRLALVAVFLTSHPLAKRLSAADY